MGHVYGDSTPFPHDTNFIELIRHAVECGCTLLAAQHAITEAVDRSGNLIAVRKQERDRFDAMGDAIKLTLTAFLSSSSERMVRTATRLLDSARTTIEAEVNELEGHTTGQLSSTRSAVEHARDLSFRAIEALLLGHDLPDTVVGLRLLARDDAYDGTALVKTPFGIEAVFALAIPAAHEWGRIRRVADLSAGTEVHVPKESGWISKRMEMVAAKLDKLVVAEVMITSERSLITLRKGPRSGGGYQLAVSTEGAPRATLARLGEDGQATTDPLLGLGGEDSVHATRLWNRVVESTRDLAARRRSMRSGSFDGKQLGELDEPAAVCARLVAVLAPTVREIARRSGAPGEMVLRRDLGQGRREEIYITKAELHEKVMAVPPTLRSAFDSFELEGGPRSPRAPAPSEPSLLIRSPA